MISNPIYGKIKNGNQTTNQQYHRYHRYFISYQYELWLSCRGHSVNSVLTLAGSEGRSRWALDLRPRRPRPGAGNNSRGLCRCIAPLSMSGRHDERSCFHPGGDFKKNNIQDPNPWNTTRFRAIREFIGELNTNTYKNRHVHTCIILYICIHTLQCITLDCISSHHNVYITQHNIT